MANGLMAFWADIDADYVLRYQRWHSCEHIPERVSIPGFLAGRRYRAMDDTPRFLMIYETEGPKVLTSPAYLAALNAPTAWTREALTHFRNPVRTVYSILAGGGTGGGIAAPYVRTLRFDLAGGAAEPALAGWIAAAAGTPGVKQARVWKSDAAGSDLATSERAIYGGGPGRQAFVALIEFAAPPQDDPVAAADRAVPEVAQGRRGDETETFWLEVAHRAPALTGELA